MATTTWNNRSLWQANKTEFATCETVRHKGEQRSRDDHELEVVDEEDRTYVISHAGLLQRHTGLSDVLKKVSKGVIIIPLVLLALAVPVILPLWSGASYLLIVLCLGHLILVSTVLAVWAIAVSYLDMKRGEEAMEARPMTAGDNDPSMGARSLPAKNIYADRYQSDEGVPSRSKKYS